MRLWAALGDYMLGGPWPVDDHQAQEVSDNEPQGSQVSSKQIDWIESPSSGG